MNELPVPGLTFHHVGCAVANIQQSLAAYRPLSRGVSQIFDVTSQGVRVCFVEIAPGVHVELIEPAGENSKIGQLLQNRINFYHLAFLADDFDSALQQLRASRYILLNTFRSEAFGMRRCAFLANPVVHIIEIIEAGAASQPHLPA